MSQLTKCFIWQRAHVCLALTGANLTWSLKPQWSFPGIQKHFASCEVVHPLNPPSQVFCQSVLSSIILPVALIEGRVICRSDSGVGLFGLLCIPGVAFLFAYYAFHPELSGVMHKGYFPENRSQTVQMKMQVWIYLPTMQLILFQAIWQDPGSAGVSMHKGYFQQNRPQTVQKELQDCTFSKRD